MIYSKSICLWLAGSLCGILIPVQAAPKADTQTHSKSVPSQSFASLPFIDPEEAANTAHSVTLTKEGDSRVQRLDWQNAKQDYQQALDLWPDNSDALYGLAKCSLAARDQTKAIAYYRKAVYSSNPADKGFKENDTTRLMEFALLLNKAGLAAEAMFVYNHAAYALDYEDSENHGGKPALKVLFPEVVTGDALLDQVPYTPERLQALADSLLAYKQQGFWSYKEIKAHAEEAAKLYPDSAPVQYYLGEALSGSYYAVLDSPAKDKAAALAAYQEDKKAVPLAYKKALELGDDATVAAAKERLGLPR